MVKHTIFLLFFLIFLGGSGLWAQNAGGISYGWHLEPINFTNSSLDCHYFGIFGFELNRYQQRSGWFIGATISSIDPALNVMGSLDGGLMVGQGFRLGPVYGSANLLGGIGLSVSDLGSYPGHIKLTGEVQLELGVYIAPWIQLGLYGGLQGFTNLLPLPIFEEYALYFPTVGIKLIWGAD